MSRTRILLVDDDMHMRESVAEVLKRNGYEVTSVSGGEEAIGVFVPDLFDCIISDVKMPVMSGIELLKKIREKDKIVPFIIMTAFGDIDLAVDAMKNGAYDFIEKGPDILDKLEFTVYRAVQHSNLLNENKALKDSLGQKWDYVGNNSNIIRIKELITSIAPSKSTVLITGESGTGKELIARAIHFKSNRNSGPFIKVNCAALPENLIESELFGHEKGAFTGAIKDRAGKFEAASGGTILLDEIGEMPLSVQAKLLRVLQEKEITKVGSDNTIDIDVRVVATTNRDLKKDVEDGKFREDLFYRLNVFHIKLPPLRERKDDIPYLVEHFIKKYNDENGFSVEGITEGGLKKLMEYEWPGNIRELENSIERAVVLKRSGTIDESFFDMGTSLTSDGISPGQTIAEVEKKLIIKTLQFCENNKTKAAEMLGISIRTLRNKLHEYGMM